MTPKGRLAQLSSRSLFDSPQHGQLTQLGCPDCRGVLAVKELGENGYLSFSCQVGHTFSEESLLERKEAELEESLWVAVGTSEELKRLLRLQADKARADGAESVAVLMEQKLFGAAACADDLRRLLLQELAHAEASE